MKFTLDGWKFWAELFPRSHIHAQDLADEYYIWLGEFSNESEAAELRPLLVQLSVLSHKEQLVADRAESERRAESKGLSSTVAIGFEPDQVLYSRAPYSSDLWIVGLDLERNQGNLSSTSSRFEKIRDRFNNFENEFRTRSSLADLASSLRAPLEAGEVRFFDAVEYESRHGVLGRPQNDS